MSVASKNLYDLLGNDDDGTETPSAPVKTVDKTSTHTTKRNTDGVAPARAPAPAGNRRGGGLSGNEAAFRDRNAGADRNRVKGTDEATRGGPRGGREARGRGGRGGRFPREKDDRHSKGPAGGNSEKQAAQGWGATEGDAELKDEQAGEAIAQTEAKVAEGEAAAEEPEEPEEKQITLDAYLAQQAEKRAGLDSLQIRKANEGSKENKKWNTAKELVKDDDEDFITPTAGKTERERERKVKQVVDIDQRYVEPPQTRGGARGGRGGARGGPRGDRGDFRGGRGAPRGGRGGAPRGGASAPINTSDESAFPTLGK